jgi:hypothetical protein
VIERFLLVTRQFDHLAQADDLARPVLMTNRGSDARPVPPGKPRHATPYRRTRRRRPERKVNPGLRATIPWVVGLCAVVAAVLVVAAESPQSGKRDASDQLSAGQRLATQPNATSPATHPDSGTTSSPAATGTSGTPATDVAGWHWHAVADFSGTGTKTTSSFRVKPHQKWNLRWSFYCPSATQDETFEIQYVPAATGQVDTIIMTTAAAGRGTDVVDPDGAGNYLIVTSSCSWTAKAIQRS